MLELFYYCLLAVGLSCLLALFAHLKKALTAGALLMAWSFSVIITLLSGIGGFTILCAVFVFTILADKIGKRKTKREKPEVRAPIQILSNVGTGTLVILICAAFNLSMEGFFLYACAMAASLADSMASGIGILSKKDPVCLFTRTRVPRGQSGGVSLLGIGASLLGGLIIAGFHFIFTENLLHSGLVALAGLIGSLADSFFGTFLQGKFICKGKESHYTEKRFCHGKPAQLTHGYAWIDNNMVNLFNNLFSALFGLILLLLIPIP
ncbi:MAG: DUF92 domain-containing protein [Clostridia bacterium]|nr:DUF92 domain-containing protein [Clostridia bacterium]